MPYPEALTMARYDAAQGRDDTPNDASELEWIKGALEMMNEAADRLRGVEASDAILTDTCQQAGADIEVLIAAIARRMP